MNESTPVAWLELPPTIEPLPVALLLNPPVTVEKLPLAVLQKPPTTLAAEPDATLVNSKLPWKLVSAEYDVFFTFILAYNMGSLFMS